MNEITKMKIFDSIKNEYKTIKMITNDTGLTRNTVEVYLAYFTGADLLQSRKYANAKAFKVKK